MRELTPEAIMAAVLDQSVTTPDLRLNTIRISGRVGADPSAIIKRSAEMKPRYREPHNPA